jgi:hypothetical protein
MNAQNQYSQREYLSPPQRFGELVSMVFMFLFLAYFVYLQVANTGFYTSAFGPAEMFFVYGPMLLSFVAPLTRALTGRRQAGRPPEILTNLLMTAAAIWLLVVFPFNFAHLADGLPMEFRFLLAWVNDTIGHIVLIVELIVCPLVAIATTWQYIAHRARKTEYPPQIPSVV